MLNSLQDKWNPSQPQPEDYEELQIAAADPGQSPDMVEFNPNITTHGTITDAFRIFTKPLENPEMSTRAPDTRHT